MRLILSTFLLLSFGAIVNAQFFSALRNLFGGGGGGSSSSNSVSSSGGGSSSSSGGGGFFGLGDIFGGGGGRFTDDGTQSPVSTGNDELYPTDCGRDTDKGTGKLCFPDGLLCKNRLNNGGIEKFGNHNYLFTWQSNDARVRSGSWDWFNARNYCRKRCMDLVSIETKAESDWLKQRLGGTKYIWTSGRLCNFDGCDRDDFFPKNINGWFWAANNAKMNPTNGRSFQEWSHTGGSSKKQPDSREGEEACMAVLNNFYDDGIKWHDVACHHEKPIVCEDTEGHLNFARQNFPNIQIP